MEISPSFWLALGSGGLSLASLCVCIWAVFRPVDHDCPAESTILGWEQELEALNEVLKASLTRLNKSKQALDGAQRRYAVGNGRHGEVDANGVMPNALEDANGISADDLAALKAFGSEAEGG